MSSRRHSDSRKEVKPGDRLAANRGNVLLVLKQETRKVIGRLRAPLTGHPNRAVHQLLELRYPCGVGALIRRGLPFLGGWTTGKQEEYWETQMERSVAIDVWIHVEARSMSGTRRLTRVESTPLAATVEATKTRGPQPGAARMKRTTKYVALDVHQATTRGRRRNGGSRIATPLVRGPYRGHRESTFPDREVL
jgi:hypothetical protein